MVSKGRGNFLKVKCIICGKTLVKSRGAKAKIMAHIDKVLN